MDLNHVHLRHSGVGKQFGNHHAWDDGGRIILRGRTAAGSTGTVKATHRISEHERPAHTICGDRPGG
ncbi:hypothetical protein SDC9_189889 [bioreactor metagenome]|uniref:Uncharacterized protein n=1 Tax=bioreactor metagenome TaxID=1076179 RepID=A0A645HV33_9ZZZZ